MSLSAFLLTETEEWSLPASPGRYGKSMWTNCIGGDPWVNDDKYGGEYRLAKITQLMGGKELAESVSSWYDDS